MTWKTCFAVLGAICCFSPLAQPQQSAAKTQTLRGTVQQVNAVTKQISVLNEPVPGGMGSMTMSYSVKDAILLRLKAGDHITASMS